MGYLLKAGIGAALFLGSIVLFNVKLIELLETGTCASGNTPYEIARPCPEGTGTDMLLLTGSIFGGLIGAAIFAFRGDPPWGARRRSFGGMFGLGAFAWGLFFTATGATALYTSLTNDTIGEDGELGGMIVGITFLVMGVPVFLISLWTLGKGMLGGRDERPEAGAGSGAGPAGGIMGRMQSGLQNAQSAANVGGRMGWGSAGSAPAGSGKGGDTIGKIERLQKLRESGAINDAEFEREKAKILAEQ
jgi:hypothetical protein